MSGFLFWAFYATLAVTAFNAWNAKTKAGAIVCAFSLIFAPLAPFVILELIDSEYFYAHVTPLLVRCEQAMLLIGFAGVVWNIIRRPWRTGDSR